jgi:hypothetical protein
VTYPGYYPEEPPAALPPEQLDWDDLIPDGPVRDPADVEDELRRSIGEPPARRRTARIEGDPEAVAELRKELGI